MNKIAFVTASFGGVDCIKPLPPHGGIDAILYTDMDALVKTSKEVMRTWDRVIVNPSIGYSEEAWLRSRFFKQQINAMPDANEYEYLAWSDASLQFMDMGFINDDVQRLEDMPENERAMFVRHPDRKTVEDEFEFVVDQIANGNEYLRTRYDCEDMEKQIHWLESSGMNCADAQLWCAGFFILENSPLMHKCLNNWWRQTDAFGRMDQLSLTAAFEFNGVGITDLHKGMNIYRNEYFYWKKG